MIRTVKNRSIYQKNNSLLDIATASNIKRYSEKDITVCVGIRLTEANPWIVERLEFLLGYYDPKPQFLIVDFGSEDDYQKTILNICSDKGARYLHVQDNGVFSASRARNIAGNNVTTDLILFNDIDVVFDRDVFAKLTELANALMLSIAPRRCIFFPVYHVTKWISQEYQSIKDANHKNLFLKSLTFNGVGTNFGKYFQFVAPYSNIFLITKKFFDLSGGYCDLFRGHGSEDFEYIIRLGILSSNAPLPFNLISDLHGPLKPSFWKSANDYTGFRKFAEAITLPSEIYGLKCFHLFHDSPKDKGYWTKNNDWKRDNFNAVLSEYYPNLEKILEKDYLKRNKEALCIFGDRKQWGYFLPLRSCGFKLKTLCTNDIDTINTERENILKGLYDRIFIFNPYMKSHAKYFSLIEQAKKSNIKVTIIERGGLPNSLYYADEVVYGDKEYHDLDRLINSYEIKTLEKTKQLIKKIKQGNSFLENQTSYKESADALDIQFANCTRRKIFIPLQLSEDMAVTRFTDGYISYNSFINELNEAIIKHKEYQFIIKRHPLSNETLKFTSEDNVTLVDNNLNIHALIEKSDYVMVYNSGVGLLSCIHNKPTFNIGNSYYSAKKNLSNFCNGPLDAIALINKNQFHLSTEEFLIKFIDWLTNTKYSWFYAKDIIRDFGSRKSHAYDNIVVESLNIDNKIIGVGNGLEGYQVTPRSYLNHRINLFDHSDSQSNILAENLTKEHKKRSAFKLMKKLLQNPYKYCEDSEYKLVRALKVLFKSK